MRNFLKQPFSNALAILATVVIILALVFSGAGLGDLAPLALGGAGVTTLDSLTLNDDLVVTDDATVSGDLAVTGALTASGALTATTSLALTGTNVAGGSANPFDITSALGIMNGSDDYTAIDINLTNADHTGSNTVQAVDISNITGDGQATEYAINVGTGWDRGLSIAGGGAVIVGTFTVDNDEIGAAEIANVTRYVPIPLGSFIECTTDAGALIGFDTTADALPDYVNSATDGTGFVIRFDATSGSEDTGMVCGNFLVPDDYVSGGAFQIRALKSGHTGATEVINCAVSVNGATLEAVGTVTTTASASTAYTCTPTIAALAVDDSVSFHLNITSGSTMDEQVDIAAVAFVYTASQ